jgi:hypothetical protein
MATKSVYPIVSPSRGAADLDVPAQNRESGRRNGKSEDEAETLEEERRDDFLLPYRMVLSRPQPAVVWRTSRRRGIYSLQIRRLSGFFICLGVRGSKREVASFVRDLASTLFRGLDHPCLDFLPGIGKQDKYYDEPIHDLFLFAIHVLCDDGLD